uniref:Zinc finger CCCH domain-containing protein 42 n=1 Tax=Anthurium amnicola TaxID=1678845 RepID=A0A1D1XLX3_9ARAE
MQQRDEVQVEEGLEHEVGLEHEEGELPQEGPLNILNENDEYTLNNNNNDTNIGEVSEAASVDIQRRTDKPLCRYFARGFCRYGENCRFSHDDQLQQNGQGQGQGQGQEYQNGVEGTLSNGNEVQKYGVLTHPRSSTPCRFFAKGYCRYGDDCKFTHNDNNNNRFQTNGLVIPNGIVHPPPPHYQQPYGDWNSYPSDGDNNVIKTWDEDSQEPMHQTSYY